MTDIDLVVQYMVAHSSGGLFYGSPDKLIDMLSDVTHEDLLELDLVRTGEGVTERWSIPESILNRFGC